MKYDYILIDTSSGYLNQMYNIMPNMDHILLFMNISCHRYQSTADLIFKKLLVDYGGEFVEDRVSIMINNARSQDRSISGSNIHNIGIPLVIRNIIRKTSSINLSHHIIHYSNIIDMNYASDNILPYQYNNDYELDLISFIKTNLPSVHNVLLNINNQLENTRDRSIID